MPDRDLYNRNVERKCEKAARYLHESPDSTLSTYECALYLGHLLEEDGDLRNAIVTCVGTTKLVPELAHAELTEIIRNAESPYVEDAANRVSLYMADCGSNGPGPDDAGLSVALDILCGIMRSAASPKRHQHSFGKPGSLKRLERLRLLEANIEAFRRSPELCTIGRSLLRVGNTPYRASMSVRRATKLSQEEILYAVLPL